MPRSILIITIVVIISLHIFSYKVHAVNRNELSNFVEVSFGSKYKHLPIQSPRPLNQNILGCYSDFSKSNLYNTTDVFLDGRIPENSYFTQHSNDNGNYCTGSQDLSLCDSTNSINLYTSTGGICYSKNKKEIKLSVNSANQPYKGCNVNSNPENQGNPGGYDIYGMINFFKQPNNVTKLSENIAQLDGLNISIKINNISYQYETCSGIGSINNKEPFVTYTPYYNGNPVSLVLSSIMLYNNTTNTSLFYNISMWDNRTEFRYREESPATNCSFPTTVGEATFYLADDSVTKYKLPPAEIGTKTYEYSLDILPRLKEIIKECKPTDSLNNWKITGAYFGVENLNATNTTTKFINPKITLIEKSLGNFTPLYEIYCKENKDHAYLTSKLEIDTAVNNMCINNGIIGYVSKNNIPNSLPLYRLWSNTYTDNFYTTNENEKNLAVKNGWTLIEVMGYLSNQQIDNTKKLYALIEKPENETIPIDRILTSDLSKKEYLINYNEYKEETFLGYIYTLTNNNLLGDTDLNNILNSKDTLKTISEFFYKASNVNTQDLNYDKKVDLIDIIESVQLTN